MEPLGRQGWMSTKTLSKRPGKTQRKGHKRECGGSKERKGEEEERVLCSWWWKDNHAQHQPSERLAAATGEKRAMLVRQTGNDAPVWWIREGAGGFV
jgi:hypothetical protein